jgi:predicted metal-dependent phosphoesterase TrpH
MKFADLHLHTSYSDGTYSASELIEKAKKAGLACISVVDHDTVAGTDDVIECAGHKGIEAIAGIELTCECDGLEIHILGYLIDYKNKELIERLEVLRKVRIGRIHKITRRLKSLDIPLEADTVFGLAGRGTVGRLHVARAMVNEGLVGSTTEAFRKYIGEKCPAYIAGFRLAPKDGIGLIKRVGGIPVLAHPYSLNRDELIPQLVDYGLMGLEAYYPEHKAPMVERYLKLAKKYGLLVTGGSDCHGSAKPEVKLGSLKIPYELVVKLKEAKGFGN